MLTGEDEATEARLQESFDWHSATSDSFRSAVTVAVLADGKAVVGPWAYRREDALAILGCLDRVRFEILTRLAAEAPIR